MLLCSVRSEGQRKITRSVGALRVVAMKAALTWLSRRHMICCPLVKTASSGIRLVTPAWRFLMVLLLPMQAPEPRQLIPRPVARGIAARALRKVAVVKSMLRFCYSEMKAF